VGEFDPVTVLRTLNEHDVRFVVIGGVGARLRGAPLITEDIDITPDTDSANLINLAEALRALDARPRTVVDPDGIPLLIDADVLATAESWTLMTESGDLDLVFSPDGIGSYDDLARSADSLSITPDGSLQILVATLDDIIRSKEAAGRDKDLAALPLLRRTRDDSAGR
jgi:hypothetical protein